MMRIPSPDGMGLAPSWDNYVVAQTVQASLGLIPRDALAVGVEVEGTHIRIHFQLSDSTDESPEDVGDIVEDLKVLMGDAARVEAVQEVLDVRRISPRDRVRWIFLARLDDP